MPTLTPKAATRDRGACSRNGVEPENGKPTILSHLVFSLGCTLKDYQVSLTQQLPCSLPLLLLVATTVLVLDIDYVKATQPTLNSDVSVKTWSRVLVAPVVGLRDYHQGRGR